MNKTAFTLIALLLSVSATLAQTAGSFEVGIKAGGTFTYGFTTIPAQPTRYENLQVPRLENKNNGIGYGYSGGLWARRNFSTFFLQTEVSFNRFVLKQKTNVTLDVNASNRLASQLPVSVQPGLLMATLNATSESVLEAVTIPLLIGKRCLGGRLRVYAGPTFLAVTKAEGVQLASGQIKANSSIGIPDINIPETSNKTNLLNKYEAESLEVKDFTYAVEGGLGISPLNGLDIDLRLALPVGGVYYNRDIKGFLGIGTLTVGYRLINTR